MLLWLGHVQPPFPLHNPYFRYHVNTQRPLGHCYDGLYVPPRAQAFCARGRARARTAAAVRALSDVKCDGKGFQRDAAREW
jgi:hypothetical protein